MPQAEITFDFDCRKTVQAASLLARLEPRETLSRMRLLKLLYISDREALAEIGRPITGDALTAMRKGPVLSEFYDMIKGESVHSAVFDKYFQNSGYHIIAKKAAGNSLLNKYEIRKLREVSKRYLDADDEDLSDLTHTFEEWDKHKPAGNSSNPIPVEDVLQAIGKASRADAVKRAADFKASVDALWG